jgi:hypothetical protein
MGRARIPLGAAVIKQIPHKCQYSYFNYYFEKKKI